MLQKKNSLLIGMTVLFLTGLCFGSCAFSGKNLEDNKPGMVALAKLPKVSKKDKRVDKVEKEKTNQEKETVKENGDEGIKRQVERWVTNMSLEDKVAQMFITNPSDLINAKATAAGPKVTKALKTYPVSGFVIQDNNIENPQQLKSMLNNAKEIADKLEIPPLIFCLDEEGGVVQRIGDHKKFPEKKTEDMYSVGKRCKRDKSVEPAYKAGEYIGSYLKKYGFNMDLAPVIDIWTNQRNRVIGNRAFSDNPKEVADYASAFAEGLKAQKITPVFKHFPGHGDTIEDTHTSKAFSNKTKEELLNCEFIPFKKAIEDHAEVIMISHVSFPKLDQKYPASLSYKITTELLRKEMGFDKLIMTDALGMAAVRNAAGRKVAVQAIQAGNDLLLIGEGLETMHESVCEAVKNKEISEERIDESVVRILTYKAKMLMN